MLSFCRSEGSACSWPIRACDLIGVDKERECVSTSQNAKEKNHKLGRGAIKQGDSRALRGGYAIDKHFKIATLASRNASSGYGSRKRCAHRLSPTEAYLTLASLQPWHAIFQIHPLQHRIQPPLKRGAKDVETRRSLHRSAWNRSAPETNWTRLWAKQSAALGTRFPLQISRQSRGQLFLVGVEAAHATDHEIGPWELRWLSLIAHWVIYEWAPPCRKKQRWRCRLGESPA